MGGAKTSPTKDVSVQRDQTKLASLSYLALPFAPLKVIEVLLVMSKLNLGVVVNEMEKIEHEFQHDVRADC